jgi:hypothetical protein
MPDDLAERTLHLEREVAEMKVTASEQRAKVREELAANTAAISAVKHTAEGVKRDTEEIVSLLKGMRILGGLAKWVGGPSTLGLGVYWIGTRFKWWG